MMDKLKIILKSLLVFTIYTFSILFGILCLVTLYALITTNWGIYRYLIYHNNGMFFRIALFAVFLIAGYITLSFLHYELTKIKKSNEKSN